MRARRDARPDPHMAGVFHTKAVNAAQELKTFLEKCLEYGGEDKYPQLRMQLGRMLKSERVQD